MHHMHHIRHTHHTHHTHRTPHTLHTTCVLDVLSSILLRYVQCLLSHTPSRTRSPCATCVTFVQDDETVDHDADLGHFQAKAVSAGGHKVTAARSGQHAALEHKTSTQHTAVGTGREDGWVLGGWVLGGREGGWALGERVGWGTGCPADLIAHVAAPGPDQRATTTYIPPHVRLTPPHPTSPHPTPPPW